jgi:catechol 2,3-dioxygenase-like lactoylglutathione lyase family enzyme
MDPKKEKTFCRTASWKLQEKRLPMGTSKLLYVGIRVTNMERSLKFYTKGFGLIEVESGTMNHGGAYTLLEDPETKQRLELNYYPPGTRFYTPFSAGEGLDHVGFEVNDAKSAYKTLLTLGAKPAVEPWTEGGTLIGFLTDPDGNWIELQSRIE